METEMNRDELLTDMVMKKVFIPRHKCWNEIEITYSREKFTFAEYDVRRTELINCPPDSEAPEWAKWKAQSSNGFWGWYDEKPEMVDYGFRLRLGFGIWGVSRQGKIPAGHRWQDTLTEVKTMTTTAHEDQYAPDVSDPEEDQAWNERKAQLDREKAEKVKEWIGPEDGLPPVGTVCEWKSPSQNWKRGYIIATFEDRVWLTTGDGLKEQVWNSSVIEFRPILTDRERWIEAAHSASTLIDDNDFVRKVLGDVFDAGLARLPGASNETP